MADQAHLEDSELFKTLMDNLHEGVYFVDSERSIQYWNKGAERLTGYAADEVVGSSCYDNILMHVDQNGKELCDNDCPLVGAMCDGKQRDERIFLRHKDGHRLPVHVGISPIRDEDGAIIGGIETFYDDSVVMAALDEAERLKELALICPLTGVGNRQYTEEILHQRFDEMKRTDTRLAVLFIDIDHFKKFNDTYGHQVGDVVLKMVANTMAGTLRSYDFLGRWGGEEFVAILPRIKPMELQGAAERIRTLVEQSSRKISENKINVTISIGAYLCQPQDTIDSIVDSADKLMYESKDKGRNRVTTNC